MKTRIRELAELATARCANKQDNSAWVWEDTFAKIIIDECIAIAIAAERANKIVSTKLMDQFYEN